MIDPIVEEMVSRIPPGDQRPAAPDWLPTETALGRKIPADYKELVARYGAGSFDDSFISLLSPNSNPNLDLLSYHENRIKWLRVHAEVSGNPAFDERELILVPWAFTENGDVFFWVTEDASGAEDWPIEIHEPRGDRIERFGPGAPSALLGILLGRVRVDSFPEDFPSDDPQFQPYLGDGEA